MSQKPYYPTHGFQNLRSFAQWLWVFRPGQGYQCLTEGPKIISCKFGTDIFKNMHTVTKTNFWSAQSGFNLERPEWIQKATNCVKMTHY